MLYAAETWAMTAKMKDVMKSHDRKMLRYMAGVRWQDRNSSEEVAKRCGLKEMQEMRNETEKVAMVL